MTTEDAPCEFVYLDHSTVEYVDHMGDDARIAMAAWASRDLKAGVRRAAEKPDDVPGVIKYLARHRHGTPFEQNAIQLAVHAPIFVWREWHRHRIGFCLAGDTEIWTESIGLNHGRTLRKRRLKDLCDVWNNGVKDSMGRTRFLPSVKNQRLRVLNEDTGFFESGGIENVFESGVKECLFVETEHKKGWSLRCSKDHRILTSEGWVKAGDLTGSEWVAVNGKKSAFEHRQVPPSLRAGIGVWTSMQRAALIPKDTDCYLCGKPFHRDNLTHDHVVPVVENLKLALDVDNLKAACISCHRTKSDKEQVLANRCNLAASRFVRLKRKPYVVSEEMTYDITMKGPWHNFVANGIVVHNSYNEQSARYSTLDPVFYVPPRDRPMMKVDGWKPGRPKFDPCADDVKCNDLVANLKDDYIRSYMHYRQNLEMGFDPGLARDGLPVGIFSSCWVTCNVRSALNFLSLRVHAPAAPDQPYPSLHVSYPLWEIDQCARQVEAIVERLFPVAYRAFLENGRVAP